MFPERFIRGARGSRLRWGVDTSRISVATVIDIK